MRACFHHRGCPQAMNDSSKLETADTARVMFFRRTLPMRRFSTSHARTACLLITCNRDDFLELASHQPHHGIIVIIRRRTRAAERAALFRLLKRAGETGLQNNLNFA